MTDRNNKTLGRIFSGAQPTGSMHLGNYLGAIRNWVRLQESYDCIYCVVDLHAITTFQDPKLLADQTREAAATYMAAGVDPEHSILFNQSQVAAHAELAWIFACVARVGWLNRMTQFKDKAGKHREKASIGLYSYPTLMAADIMVYKATHVPAGEDQRQHLELTRDIAQKFNSDFGVEYFPLVEALTLGGGTRVMSLRDGNAKMSKSDPSDYSRLSLSDDRDMIAKKIRKARTDGDPLPGEIAGLKDRPEALNLVTIFASLADRKPDDVLAEFAGRGFADFKAALTDLAIDKLGPITDELNRLKADPGHVDGVLRDGARRAAAIAGPILRQVQEIVGFLRP